MADLTPIRPPNIPPALWNQMSPEDQQQARIDYFGAEAGPAIGGFAPAPPPPPPPTEPPRAPAAVKPTGPTWAYVRSLNSFPGNHPYFDADRAAGITGYFLEAHDPYIESGAAACRGAGFDVGVWADPHGASAQAFAADIIGAAHRIGATTIAPDPESTGKGGPGSPGWVWNQDAANFIRALDPNIRVIVTPTPDQDDFNYSAWTSNGGLVWVQLYGAKLTDLFNADEVINRVAANGVPRNMIGALIPAGAIALYVPELQKLGVSHWAIYTIDDVNATDRQTPFGGAGDQPAAGDSNGSGSSPPDDGSTSPGDDGEPPLPYDESDDYDVDTGDDVEPDDFEANAAADDEPDDAPAAAVTEGLRFLAVHRTPPHGGIHPTKGLDGFPALDLFAAPYTRVLAPIDGLIYKLSGHDPATGWHPAPGGAFGWSIYLKGSGYGGVELYITHLQTRRVRQFERVRKGQVIGTVGNMIGRQPHIHVGMHGGTIGVLAMLKWDWFRSRNLPAVPPGHPVPTPEPPPGPVKLPARVRINKPWDHLMSALDPELKSRAVTIRQVGRNIRSRVK